MLQVQKFIEENATILRETYDALLQKFESAFPRITTAMHFLYWGFIRIRLASVLLESSSDSTKAFELLEQILLRTQEIVSLQLLADKLQYPERFADGGHCSSSDLILLDSFAGLFQTLFNLLAASVPPPGSDAEQLSRKHANRALHWLQCAKRVHELYVGHNNQFVGPVFWEMLAFRKWMVNFSDATDKLGHESPRQYTLERLLFEHGYTNTIFLLAQTYQLLNEPTHAANCCQLTLFRQLTYARPFYNWSRLITPLDRGPAARRAASARRCKDVNRTVYEDMQRQFSRYVGVQSFDPLEWARNAMALGDYYARKEEADGYYYCALECLVSACAILDDTASLVPRRSPKSAHRLAEETRADVYRALGKFELSLLEKGVGCLSENPRLLDVEPAQTASESANDFGSMFHLNLMSHIHRLVSQSQAEDNKTASVAPPASRFVDSLATCPTNYANASVVFRVAVHCLNEAAKHYTLDEHCSDAVELAQHRSKAYKLMVHFERDEARQCRMHKRRIDTLEKVLAPLNRKHYLLLCRQLMFELGDALMTLQDMKHKAHEQARTAQSKSLAHYARKSNSLGKRAVEVYHEFLSTYDSRISRSDFVTNEEDIRPLMLAHFYSASVQNKLIPTAPDERVRFLAKAVNHYNTAITLVERHLRHHPQSPIRDAAEVQIARQMAQLLSVKTTKLARQEPGVN